MRALDGIGPEIYSERSGTDGNRVPEHERFLRVHERVNPLGTPRSPELDVDFNGPQNYR